MTRYYNRCYMFISVFKPSNKIYLDSTNIHTMYPSVKLVYWCLKLYTIEK